MSFNDFMEAKKMKNIFGAQNLSKKIQFCLIYTSPLLFCSTISIEDAVQHNSIKAKLFA